MKWRRGLGERRCSLRQLARQVCELSPPSPQPSPTPASWEREKNRGQRQDAPEVMRAAFRLFTPDAQPPTLRAAGGETKMPPVGQPTAKDISSWATNPRNQCRRSQARRPARPMRQASRSGKTQPPRPSPRSKGEGAPRFGLKSRCAAPGPAALFISGRPKERVSERPARGECRLIPARQRRSGTASGKSPRHGSARARASGRNPRFARAGGGQRAG